MGNNKILQIGSQSINIEELKKLEVDAIIEKLQQIYKEGYAKGIQKVEDKLMDTIGELISVNLETNIVPVVPQIKEVPQETTKPLPSAKIKAEEGAEEPIKEGKLEIPQNLNNQPKTLNDKMREIESRLKRFSKKGFAIVRYAATEEEYVKNKYHLTNVPMKAMVFDSQEEADRFKDTYWVWLENVEVVAVV
ncbi:MAG: hypothetical protein GY810_27655 [Aureispira sp.]|nr:hypothetical protein [Aureispira sp.]